MRRCLHALSAAVSLLGCVAALAGPVTREEAEDGSSAAGLVATSGSAWWLQASGRLDAPTDEGHEMTLSDDAAGLVLALLRGARAHEAAKSAVGDSPVQTAEAAASGVARSSLHEPPAAPLLDGGLVGLLTERQIAFVSEAREWYQSMGELPGDAQPQAAGDAGPGLSERARADRPAREHLIPPWLIEFLRDNRMNLFYVCVGGLVLMLAFDIARRRAARGSVGKRQPRATSERRTPSDRRSAGESHAARERRSGEPRRSLPERRGPEPAVR